MSSVLNELYVPANQKLLLDALKGYAKQFPNKSALSFYNDLLQQDSINYYQLFRKIESVAANLQQVTKPYDRVLIILPPGIELIAAFLGCLYSKNIAVLCYPPQTDGLKEKICGFTENAKPAAIISDHAMIAKIKKLQKWRKFTPIPLLRGVMRNITQDKLLWDWPVEKLSCLDTSIIHSTLSCKLTPIIHRDIAFLQYSSGTTGQPKGIMISHENLVHNLKLIHQGFNFEKIENSVSWLPPYHDMGLIGGILSGLYAGIHAHLISPMVFLRKPLNWLKLISMYPNVLSGAPNFAYDYCVKKISDKEMVGLDLSNWSVAFNGAESVKEETMHAFYEKFKSVGFKKESFSPCYGLAEGTLLVSVNNNLVNCPYLNISKSELKKSRIQINPEESADSVKMVSCGISLQSVKIINQETGHDCKDAEIGEIWISSPSVSRGYWTKNSLDTGIQHTENPWIATGDLGFMFKNHLYVTGRSKELINIHGEKHYPQDIEHSIKMNIPYKSVPNCCAFSIVDKNKEEHLVIMCETSPVTPQDKLKRFTKSIIDLINQNHNLSVHALLFVPLRTIKKTTSGKIRRGLCREFYEKGSCQILYKFDIHNSQVSQQAAPAILNHEETSLSHWICAWIAKKYSIEEMDIHGDDFFIQLGLDSVNNIELITSLEKIFAITIEPTILNQFNTPNKLANHLTDNYPIDLKQLPDLISSKTIPINSNPIHDRDINNAQAVKTKYVFESLKKFRQEKLIGLNVIPHRSKPNSYRFLELQDKPLTGFFSCSYMGLEWHPNVSDAVTEAVRDAGSQLSCSRAYISCNLYQEAEVLLEKIVGIKPIITGTTTLGHLSALPLLIEPNDVLILDEQVHNSIQMATTLCIAQGAELIKVKHNCMETLEKTIIHYSTLNKSRIWYLADGLYSMHGDFVSMPALLKLLAKYPNFYAYLDDAHSLGWLGENGKGYVAQFKENPHFNKVIITGSLSKTFAASGGVIFTMNEEWREKITLCGAPMIFSGPIQPPMLNAIISSAQIMLSNKFAAMQKELQDKIDYFKSLIVSNGLTSPSSGKSPIFFIQIGQLEKVIELCKYLQLHHYYVPPTSYPAVPLHQSGLRVTINRMHKPKEHLEGLINTIVNWHNT